MCGIVAALPSYEARLLQRPDVDALASVIPTLAAELPDDALTAQAQLIALVGDLEEAGRRSARPGFAAALFHDSAALSTLEDRAERLAVQLAMLDRSIDERAVRWDADNVEIIQRTLRRCLDLAYSLRFDRLAAVRRVTALTSRTAGLDTQSMVGYLALDQVLRAIDHLEVRGRDSAGISIWVQLTEADLAATESIANGRMQQSFLSGSVRRFSSGFAFVYKRAAIVGHLGDNVAQLRAAIAEDADLHIVLGLPSARASVLAHTRWASIGAITEGNAHPVDNWPMVGAPDRLALAVLNGDIDNHLALRRQHGYGEDAVISTDAKLVPLRLAARAQEIEGDRRAPAIASGALVEALREFDGSMAITAQLSDSPDRMLLAVKGSGQGLYVGLSETGYIVASEVYGLVATCERYLRIDGGFHPPSEFAGTVVVLPRDGAGTIDSIERLNGDGHALPITLDEVRSAELTTRDLALGGASHYLVKEIGEAASSFRKTLRGRVRVLDGQYTIDLPTSSMPAEVAALIASGVVKRVALLGQGTAAVASQGIAHVMTSLLNGRMQVRATPATEFSAYDLEADLTDTLVVAISQSGSTTDTNRTVDLARARGAWVIAIINRRDSDLAAKAHGVLYTSDGRDVEMAVASTKAFYAQVAAGCLLSLQIARLLDEVTEDREDAILQALHELPGKLEELLANQHEIAHVAQQTAVRCQNWAVVGSGPNRVAAAEARIKLSELCYRTVSTDAVEDKKHIDLSAESLVLVCTAGTPPGQLRDLQKEVGIFAAHRNVPVVITDIDDIEEWPTRHIIRVPAAPPFLAWILSTAAAHLFSFHAARAIDACADDLRIGLNALETAVDESSWRPVVQDRLTRTLERVGHGDIAGILSARTLMMLTVAVADVPAPPLTVPVCFTEHVENPTEFVRAALTLAVDEMTRSIDTVKHQAKTVTVGTSRDDADLYENQLVRALTEAGADVTTTLSHTALIALREHSTLVSALHGVTRYKLRGVGQRDIAVLSKSGLSMSIPSRAESWAPLIGSKELVARTRRPRLLRGARDGRLVFVVPEQEGAMVTGLSVIHLDLHKTASGAHLLAAVSTIRGRADELRASITEAGIDFNAEALADLPVEDVLLASAESVAAAVRLSA
ncbi:MAG: glucosamine 6-phosphate synthetase, contains amidotransferase and phosphosugar isomerase domain [Pseudonocardiales bacterium]|nr:glucosamine 6-phosphate synthetase, contains amidotransferase and phosphosugar isomerase domain [Pseudonocardiales bacterium]